VGTNTKRDKERENAYRIAGVICEELEKLSEGTKSRAQSHPEH
jgi:hypothetical protein